MDASTEKIGRILISVARTVQTVITFSGKTKIIVIDFAMFSKSLKIRLLEFVGPEIMNLNFVGG